MMPNIVRVGDSSNKNCPIVKKMSLEYMIDKQIKDMMSNLFSILNEKQTKLEDEISIKTKNLDEYKNHNKIEEDPTKSFYEQKLLEINKLKINLKNIMKEINTGVLNAECHKNRIANEILMRADIVATTLSTSGSDRIVKLNRTFDTIIIDEACQCTELSSLVPLRHGTSRVVMIGDPNQLPPTVFSKNSNKSG